MSPVLATATKKKPKKGAGKHRRRPRGVAIVSVSLGIGLLASTGIAWTQHLSDDGDVVAAGVFYNDTAMEGMTHAQVRSMVALDANARSSMRVKIRYEDGSIEPTLAELGLDYDMDGTVASIMSARHVGTALEKLQAWASVPFSKRVVEASWSYDRDTALAFLGGQEALTPTPPTEPGVDSIGSNQLELTPGVTGSTVDIEDVATLLDDINFLDPPAVIEAVQVDLPPTIADHEAEDMASRLNELTSRGVTISVQGERRTLTPGVLRAYLIIEPKGPNLVAWFDDSLLQRALEASYRDPVGGLQKPTLSVFDDEVIVESVGEPPPICCRAGSADWMGRELLAGATGPFGLPPRAADDPVVQAWADGSLVVEKVSEFTTPHNCCESRVKNIQRMADLVRGVYILPGESFSLNEFIGPRTRESGFVGGGAIRTGYSAIEVGCGVSQFATTIFNAAYVAGMDFDEYRSHSVYFSRYPYGREATISNPAPDLILNNTTDYPILVWTSYTDRSITVTMYSTAHIEVEELDQRTYRNGACRIVETDRQRTYPDDRVTVDTIDAYYRPAVGIGCSGNPIPKY
jgi:hypothetical protein